MKKAFPSPHSGILFLCMCTCILQKKRRYEVSVPSFGDSFFITVSPYGNGVKLEAVSVPSFGDSFFIIDSKSRITESHGLFPSPHSGILFLSAVILEESAEEKESFRPLIRGFFFYYIRHFTVQLEPNFVSVPSFGDSFFILSL